MWGRERATCKLSKFLTGLDEKKNKEQTTEQCTLALKAIKLCDFQVH